MIMGTTASDGSRGAETATEGPSRRRVLECMTWAGTGVLWSIAAGVPHADDKLRALLGVSSVKFIRGEQRLAIIDQSLQG
jgi:hypothetical protein